MLNVELIGFSERLDPGYERNRNMKDDDFNQQELGSCLWDNCVFSIYFLWHIGRDQSQMASTYFSGQCIVGTSYVLFSNEWLTE